MKLLLIAVVSLSLRLTFAAPSLSTKKTRGMCKPPFISSYFFNSFTSKSRLNHKWKWSLYWMLFLKWINIDFYKNISLTNTFKPHCSFFCLIVHWCSVGGAYEKSDMSTTWLESPYRILFHGLIKKEQFSSIQSKWEWYKLLEVIRTSNKIYQ